MDQDIVLMNTNMRYKLFGRFSVIFALSIILFGITLFWALDKSFKDKLHTSLNSVFLDIKYDLIEGVPEFKVLDPLEEFALSPVYIEVFEFDTDKRVLISKNMLEHHLPLLKKETETFISIKSDFIREHDGDISDENVMLSKVINVDGGKYLINIATPLDGLDELNEIFFLKFFLYGLLFYITIVYLVYKMIINMFSPLEKIIQTAASISQNNLYDRVPLPNIQNEFYVLANTFNKMLEDIENGFHLVNRFNANVSHEIKTPLTIIRGEAEVTLNREREPEAYQKVLKSIISEAESIETIVDNMLLLSRLDNTTVFRKMHDIDLKEVLMNALNESKKYAEMKGCILSFKELASIKILGDKNLLRQAVNNLLDNAIKYTSSGKHVEVSLKKHNNLAVLIIQDEGAGIEQASLDKIFEPFWREDTSHSKEILGHGLGLSIVKWIIDLHHGEIFVKSAKNKGTVFTINFTLQNK